MPSTQGIQMPEAGGRSPTDVGVQGEQIAESGRKSVLLLRTCWLTGVNKCIRNNGGRMAELIAETEDSFGLYAKLCLFGIN